MSMKTQYDLSILECYYLLYFSFFQFSCVVCSANKMKVMLYLLC